MQKLYSLLAQNEAQTMTEYATVLTVITIACLAAFTVLAAASSGCDWPSCRVVHLSGGFRGEPESPIRRSDK